MDEIDLIDKINKVIVFFGKVSAIFVGFFYLLFILRWLVTRSWDDYDTTCVLLFTGIGLGIVVFEVLAWGIIRIFYAFINNGKKVNAWEKEYIRELPKGYTPAIISFIHDLKVEGYKDYSATILHLYNKKYIDLKQEGEEQTIFVKNQDFSQLTRHEIYVLKCLQGIDIFESVKFERMIIEDISIMNLITDKKHSRVGRISAILVIGTMLLFLSFQINKTLFYILLFIILMLIFILVELPFLIIKEENTLYKRTEKGKQLAKVSNGLKNFIHEYTMIKDKSIEYVNILEDYISYAVALGEAENIEEFIKYDENYRNLIYNKKVQIKTFK